MIDIEKKIRKFLFINQDLFAILVYVCFQQLSIDYDDDWRFLCF